RPAYAPPTALGTRAGSPTSPAPGVSSRGSILPCVELQRVVTPREGLRPYAAGRGRSEDARRRPRGVPRGGARAARRPAAAGGRARGGPGTAADRAVRDRPVRRGRRGR